MKKILIFLIFILILSSFTLAVERGLPELPTERDMGIIDVDNTFGRVRYSANTMSSRELAELQSRILISPSRIEVKDNDYPELNRPATLTFKNVAYKNPVVFVNNKWNKEATERLNQINLFTYTLTVEHFSIYQIVDSDLILGTFDQTWLWSELTGDFIMKHEFEENPPLDETGIYNGTVTGAVFNATGGYNGTGAFEYSGGSDRIDLNETLLQGVNTGTIMFWIYPLDKSVTTRMVFQFEGPTNMYLRAYESSGALKFQQRNVSTIKEVNTLNYETNEWQHFAFIFTPDYNILYRNGIFQDIKFLDWGTTFYLNNSVMTSIGRSSFAYNGKIDDFRIYEEELTSQEIQAILEREEEPFIELDAYARCGSYFDEWSSTFYDDSLYGCGWLGEGNIQYGIGTGVDGNNNIIFDGVDDQLEATEYIEETEGSMAGWFRVYNNSAYSGERLFAMVDKDTAGNRNKVELYISGGINLAMAVFNKTSGVSCGTSSNGLVYPIHNVHSGKWIHYAQTWGEDGLFLYQDGVLVGNHSENCNRDDIMMEIEVGGRPISNSFKMNGSIDNWALYDYALSDEEILWLYNNNDSLLITQTEGNYTSRIYNSSDYGTGEVNVWNNITFDEDSNQVNLWTRVANSEANLLTEAWILKQNINTGTINLDLEGDFFQFLLDFNSSGDDENAVLGWTLNAETFLSPEVHNVTLLPNANVTVTDSLMGYSTYINNDSINGNITFIWYQNNINIQNSTSVITSNGTQMNFNYPNSLSVNDLVYFDSFSTTIDDINSQWIRSNNITVISSNFTYTAVPSQQNFTLKIPYTIDLNVNLIDPDGDIITTWVVEGVLNKTGTTYEFNPSLFIPGITYKIDSIMTDGFFSQTKTWYITVQSADSNITGSIAITLFILFVTGGLIALPFIKKKFTNFEISNMIIKRSFWIVGTYLMVLNSGIMANIAQASGLSLTKEMFRYMFLFGWAGYILIGFMVLKTLFDVLKLYKVKKYNERMGGDF